MAGRALPLEPPPALFQRASIRPPTRMPRLHLRTKAGRLWPSLRNRGRHGPYERRGSSRPLLSQGRAGDDANAILTSVGYHLRLVLALAKDHFPRYAVRDVPELREPLGRQIGFLTVDDIL